MANPFDQFDAPSKKGGNPFDAFDKAPTTPSKTVTSNVQQKPTPTGDAGYSAARTGGEAFARSVPGGIGFWAGAGTGAALAAEPAAIAGGAVAATGVAAPAAPIVAGAIEFGGALIGGMIGAGAVDWAVDRLSSVVDPEGYAKWKASQQAHPTAAFVGSTAGGLVGSSPKTAAEVAGKVWTKPIVQRGVSGTLMGGMSAAEQYATEGKVDPTQVAVQAAAGAALPGANVVGRAAHGVGEAVGKGVKGLVTSTKPTTELPPKPPEGASKEEQQAWLDEVKKIKAEEDSKSHVVETAIRSKSDPTDIERMGPKHIEARKTETADTHEQGFLDDRGNFLTRQEALDRAIKTGQIKPDQELSVPDEGLHSGDLRTAGDKRFDLPSVPNEVDGVAITHGSTEKTRPDGRPIGATTRRNPDGSVKEVVVDVDTLYQQFHEKPWTQPKVEGVDPLPEDAFKTPQEWVDFVVQHEVEHTKTPRAEGQSKPEYENQTNQAALKAIEEKKSQPQPTKEEAPGINAEEQQRLKNLAAEVRRLDKSWKDKYDKGDHAGGDADLRALGAARKEMFDLQNKLSAGRETTPDMTETSRVVTEPTTVKSEEDIPKFVEGLDPRTFVSKEEMTRYGAEIYHRYGEEAATKFFQDWKLNQKEQVIPVPNNNEELADALHKVNTFQTKDLSEHVTAYKENTDNGVTAAQREAWFKFREGEIELSPEEQAKLEAILGPLDKENKALLDKARALGLDVGRNYSESQSRHRLFAPRDPESNWMRMVKEFFSNNTPMGEKMAEEASAAMERKVYQLSDGRVIEIHRQPKDASVPMKDGTFKQVKKGTEIWEWKDGTKKQIGHVDSLDFGVGDKWTSKGVEHTLMDGKVHDIEQHSPYRYIHDAEFSARMANMGLRKMVRDAELLANLQKSDLFKQVGVSPDTPLKDVPKGWRQPDNIDKVPQLRGWHFDPKTAAIIEDFAKVWDNNTWMKLSNQIVKNLMLNPIPHMFNEVWHLYNARGLTGWVNPMRVVDFVTSYKQAWRDVGQQSQFYRDIMREGGSILGADPRNHYFDEMLNSASQEMAKSPELNRTMKEIAKKAGTTVGDLYNGLSKKSQQAMWFTRDTMYVQLIRETMARAEKKGQPLELKDAIKEVERHMPNYRMPSEIMGSRMLSKTLQNPNVAMFSRYHYGMVKSLLETARDLNPKNLKSAEGREHFKAGLDTVLAIAAASYVIYPVMDAIAQSVFGEGATMRRAGPYHLLHAASEVAAGKKDASYLIYPVFTFNPMLLMSIELGLNKNLFTGKPVYHPEDPAGDIASDIGAYGVKKIPQASSLASSGGEAWLARQVDVQYKTEKQLAAAKRAEEYRERNRKTREKKRREGTYTP
jgi:hypothetical protein